MEVWKISLSLVNWPVSECLGRTDTEEGRGEKGPLIVLVGLYIGAASVENIIGFLQRLKKWKLR